MNRADRGSITPLVIGLAAIVTGLVVVVVDASAGYLQREGLNSYADAAALAATEGIQGARAYTEGLGEEVVVDLDEARRLVAAYLVGSGASERYPGLSWSVGSTGRSVQVRLRATLDLPVPLPGSDPQASVTGSSSAVVAVAD